MQLLSGDNHDISARDGLVTCQVWSRPDLNKERGAANAREMVDFLVKYLEREQAHCHGLLLDVRRAPAVFGPATRQTLGKLLSSARAHQKPVAVVVCESAMQSLQFSSLCQETGCAYRLCKLEPEAKQWLQQAHGRRTRTPPRA